MKAKLIKQWGWDNTIVSIGTEVTIIKGMEVDAADVLNAPYGMCYLCEFEGNTHYIPATYLTITDYSNIDWQQVRIQAAISAMQGILANDKRDGTIEDIAFASVRYTDALIEELKKNPINNK